MQETSKWIQLFAPKPARQAVWSELVEELSYPVNSTSTEQVTAVVTADGDGYGYTRLSIKDSTSRLVADRGRWRIAGRRNSKQSLAVKAWGLAGNRWPELLVRSERPTAVDSKEGDQSPYFQDSHMITPRSANRQRRLVSEIQHEEHTANIHQRTSRRSTARTTRDDNPSDDDDGPFDFYGDQTTELAQQIREITEMEVLNSTPLIELLQHRPLTQITPFRGRLDESENSMQWLRGFVYEMKGTHTPPNECSLAPSSIQENEANMESAER
ncbi:Eukaryotic/viral aspartic protease [Phytophthora megakarya]|uniref:Eukaryotic/viral aspartic protease n=1 Tax=Phytophthora megakarya TaxID=4795 RepID=A0A225VAC2_9STRA|nr:Eukaryotic/viral aspartic protease [Phytophthora megakarya]